MIDLNALDPNADLYAQDLTDKNNNQYWDKSYPITYSFIRARGRPPLRRYKQEAMRERKNESSCHRK